MQRNTDGQKHIQTDVQKDRKKERHIDITRQKEKINKLSNKGEEKMKKFIKNDDEDNRYLNNLTLSNTRQARSQSKEAIEMILDQNDCVLSMRRGQRSPN